MWTPPALAETPDLLDAVSRVVPDASARVRAANGGFAWVEHVHHLADFEVDGFGLRVDRLTTEPTPFLPDFDGDAVATARRYLEQPCAPALARFRAARLANLARLADADGDRSGIQEGVGPVTLAALVERLLDHDRAHLGRAAELLRSLHPDLPVLERIAAFVRG